MLLAFQDRRKLFMVVIVVGWRGGGGGGGGGGWGGLLNKNVGLKLAKKHWLKRLKEDPPKNFGPK